MINNNYEYNFKNLTISHKFDLNSLAENVYQDHFHSFYEIFFFVNGDIEYIIENKRFKLTQYDLLLIKPSEQHFVNLVSKGNYERFVIKFSEQYIPIHLIEKLKCLDNHFSITSTKILDIFKNIDTLPHSFDGNNLNVLFQSALNELLICISELDGNKDSVVLNVELSKILEYINNNLELNLSMESLSKEFFHSRAWVYRIFKKYLRTTPKEYITSKRMALAQRLIENGEKPTKVFNQCGFNYYSTYYRQINKK